MGHDKGANDGRSPYTTLETPFGKPQPVTSPMRLGSPPRRLGEELRQESLSIGDLRLPPRTLQAASELYLTGLGELQRWAA